MSNANKLNLSDLQYFNYALNDLIGYLTDNSCSDPDCCGGPYYEEEHYEAGIKALKRYGLEFKPNE